MSLLSKQIVVKNLHTNKIKIFYVNLNWTISQFNHTIMPNILKAFNIFDGEIISTDFNNEINSSKQLKNIWNSNSTITLYVKKKYNIENVIDECLICYENTTISKNYDCIHNVCSVCYKNCITYNYFNCPICKKY